MSITVEEINRVGALVTQWAWAKHAEGVYEGFLSGNSEGVDAGGLERIRESERACFDALAKGFKDLRAKAAQGYESEGGETVAERRTIRTLEELDALPVKAVVIEEHYEDAYQKISTDSWMNGEYTVNGPAIALPATVIYEPGVK